MFLKRKNESAFVYWFQIIFGLCLITALAYFAINSNYYIFRALSEGHKLIAISNTDESLTALFVMVVDLAASCIVVVLKLGILSFYRKYILSPFLFLSLFLGVQPLVTKELFIYKYVLTKSGYKVCTEADKASSRRKRGRYFIFSQTPAHCSAFKYLSMNARTVSGKIVLPDSFVERQYKDFMDGKILQKSLLLEDDRN